MIVCDLFFCTPRFCGLTPQRHTAARTGAPTTTDTRVLCVCVCSSVFFDGLVCVVCVCVCLLYVCNLPQAEGVILRARGSGAAYVASGVCRA